MFDCTNQMLYNGIQHKKSLGQKIIRKSLMRDYDCEVIHFLFFFLLYSNIHSGGGRNDFQDGQ